jgi:perosamine synthetase
VAFLASNIVPHNRPSIGKAEKMAALRVLGSRWLAQGAETEGFENEFCNYLGLPEGHAVAVSSGSAALYLALWALQAAGKRVYYPGYACAALRNAVALAGANGVIGDVAAGTPNIDLLAIPAAVDMVIVPHMFGIPSRVDALPQDIPVIEDCAQALGASIDGRPVGTHGKIGVFSFYATKMITTGGQGGMVVSKDRDVVEMIRDYRQFDCRHDRRTRFNFQMTDLQAAIGRVQLSRLNEFVNKREEIFSRYAQLGLALLDTADDRLVPVRYRAVWKCEQPERVIGALREAGIGSIIPIEDWELLDAVGKLPNAYRMAKQTVSLPIFPSLKNKELNVITRQLKALI